MRKNKKKIIFFSIAASLTLICFYARPNYVQAEGVAGTELQNPQTNAATSDKSWWQSVKDNVWYGTGSAEQGNYELQKPLFDQIQQQTPTTSNAYFNQEKIPGAASTKDFVDYIKQIIRFGFATIGILALFMLSVGAYQYLMAAGNLAKMESARETIYSALFGLILGLTAFLILRTINPQLVSLELKSPGGAVSQPSGGGTPSGGGATRNCEPNLGNCQTSKLGCFGSDVEKASRVCGYESVAGNPNAMSGSDKCGGPGANGESYSVGLFQINLTAHDLGMGCRSAFNGTNNNCVVVKPELYQQCVAKAKNEQFNIDYACQLYGQSGFSPWKNTVKTCGL